MTQKIKTGFKNKEISMNFIEKINKSSRKFDVIKKEKKRGKERRVLEIWFYVIDGNYPIHVTAINCSQDSGQYVNVTRDGREATVE